MPVTVVGRAAKFHGKTFFNIVCNLKDFGVGRVIVRHAFQRYQEPTYYRVVKVLPEMDEEFKSGKIWVESIWRGENLGVVRLTTGHKEDFNLIAKDEEETFCGKSFKPLEKRILPQFIEFPPLLKAKIMEERALRGEPIKEPRLKMLYNKNPVNRNRAAEEGETPNVDYVKHVSLNLYQDIIDKQKDQAAG